MPALPAAVIISEYNPFHNGHAYLAESCRQMGAKTVVAVMGGNFVQRGAPALWEKRIRAQAALLGGVDLVLELPLSYAMSPAEHFAYGGVYLADALGLGREGLLVFGSERGELSLLREAAEAVLSSSFSEKAAPYLQKGLPFAQARQLAVSELAGKEAAAVLSSPNNILAVEYLKALKQLNSPLQPRTVLRQGAGYHSSEIEKGFSSASYLRAQLRQENSIKGLVPEKILILYRQQQERADFALGERAVLSRLRSLSKEKLQTLPDLSEGLENRLYTAIREAASWRELLERAGTKRYPLARIRRILMAAFLGMDRKQWENPPPYLRILGCNQQGTVLLREIKKRTALPVGDSLARLERENQICREFAQAEAAACDQYSLFYPTIRPCGWDYQLPPVRML